MSKYLIVLILLLFNFVLNEDCVGTPTTNLDDATCGKRDHLTTEKCVSNQDGTNCELKIICEKDTAQSDPVDAAYCKNLYYDEVIEECVVDTSKDSKQCKIKKIACEDAKAGDNNKVNDTFCGLFDYNKDTQKCLPKDNTNCELKIICGKDTAQSAPVDAAYCKNLYYDELIEECVVDTSKDSKQCKIKKIACEDAKAGDNNKVNDTFCEKFYYDETIVKCVSNEKNTECITKYLCTSGTPDEDNDCGSFLTTSNEKKCVKTSDGKKCEEVNKEDEKSSSEMNKLRFFLIILILNLIY